MYKLNIYYCLHYTETAISEAFIAVAKSKRTVGEVINSASNFEISIEQTAILISKLMNSQIEILSEENRKRPDKSEVSRLFGSNKKILSLTDWKQKYGGIEGFKKGLRITIDWFTDPNNLSLYKDDYI